LLNDCIKKTTLQDILKTLSLIQAKIKAVDSETKCEALELMMGTSASVVDLAKKMTKPDTKTVARTVSISKTKILKQPLHQQRKPTTNDAE